MDVRMGIGTKICMQNTVEREAFFRECRNWRRSVDLSTDHERRQFIEQVVKVHGRGLKPVDAWRVKKVP